MDGGMSEGRMRRPREELARLMNMRSRMRGDIYNIIPGSRGWYKMGASAPSASTAAYSGPK